MGEKIILDHTTSGQNLYAVFRSSTKQYWNGSAFEDFVSGNWANYDVALSEDGTAAIYSCDIPAFVAGRYSYVIKNRAGGSPAMSDANVGSGEFSWDGTEVADIAQVIAHGDAAWATAAASDLAAGVLSNPDNKLATNGSGEVAIDSTNIAAIVTAVWAAGTRVLTAPTNLTAGIAQAVWEYATRTITASPGPSAASIAQAVWEYATRTLTAFGFTPNAGNVATANATIAKLETALEADGGVYRFTANALEQGPDSGDATQAKQEEILAAIAAVGTDNAAAIAEALMDAIIDGAVDVRGALKAAFAAAVGKIVRTSTSPPTYDLYNAAGDTVIYTLVFAADGSGREAA